ncbi:MAG: F0F1 ATP synthase subunit delta [Rhodospirillaceae bacterium]|nr:F0F1 ATP synthase subunit delta [Rhodospirillaceae bacterium]|tara:strand:- start:181 stop:741 length:561 start_codon:yes stop_codon:yes gene_type:complete
MTADGAGSSGLAARYALALYELANEADTIAQVSQDLAVLKQLVEEVPELQRLISSPVLSQKSQMAAVSVLAVEAKLSNITRKFIGLLTKNRRLSALLSTIVAFNSLVDLRSGKITAEVVSFGPLSKEQGQNLEDILKVSVGSSVAVKKRIDKSILGGLVVRIGSHMVDGSLLSKLERLKLSMKGIG